MAAPATTVAVVVPVKAFAAAKQRLSGVLDSAQRAELARAMADRVLRAAAPLPVVVACDDEVVAEWAVEHGATAVLLDGVDLNGAVTECVRRLTAAEVTRVVVAHADLPFAGDLDALAAAAADEVVMVPDRRGDGTNVISVPTGHGFRFRYGPGSFEAHRSEASRCGLRVRVVRSERLGWDVDEPADLDPPGRLGALPVRDLDPPRASR
ncbi:MAG: 2-phospho-L-lactate guanylyltransferase [Actinobacteria bacterium]|nr:2-phospho-L-lactate guanylyltransferase [Actinomycetota bacterium]